MNSHHTQWYYKDLHRSFNKVLYSQSISLDTDISKYDFIVYNELEDDDYIYISPLNFKSCVFVDSYKLGGEGAKWCIGWTKHPYFYHLYMYVLHNFPLIRISKNREQNKIKNLILIDLNTYKFAKFNQTDTEVDYIENETYDLSKIKFFNEISKIIYNNAKISNSALEKLQKK